MPLPSLAPPSLGGEISTGTFLDGWFGPTVAGSVTVVTGPPYAGVTTLLRHIATQIGYHTPALFMTTNTTCPRPDEQASHLSWMTPAGGRGGSLDWTFAALMGLVKRDDLAPVWVLDDAEQLDGPLDQLGSRGTWWARILPVLQKANVTLFIGMRARTGADGRPAMPVAIRHATRIGLELQPVVNTKGDSESLGVVADVGVWKCRSGLSGHVVDRVWLRPLHTLLVSETKGGRAR